MAGDRDIVNTTPNMRLDRPDFDAVQRNMKSEIRAVARAMNLHTNGVRILGGFLAEAQAVPDTTLKVNGGSAILAEELPDGSVEYHAVVGDETTPVQNVDFNGKPNGLYGVYIRFKHEPGENAQRVVWDDSASQEAAVNIDTRLVVDWDVQVALASPGTEWYQIASVNWAGTTVTNGIINLLRHFFFEGDETAGGYNHEWGDSTSTYPSTASDRNADRATYGVFDLYSWVHAVRRQLGDLISAGGDWFAAVPTNVTDLLGNFNAFVTSVFGAEHTGIGGHADVHCEDLTTQRGTPSGVSVPVGGFSKVQAITSTSTTSPTTETAVGTPHTIDDGGLQAGTIVEVEAWWKLDTYASGTPVFRLRFGPNATALTSRDLIGEVSAVSPASGDLYRIKARLLVLTPGANAEIVSLEETMETGESLLLNHDYSSAAGSPGLAIDTTVENVIQATMNLASGSNAGRLLGLTVAIGG